MASAVAHPLYRSNEMDQGLPANMGAMQEGGFTQYHGSTADHRMPSPLPPGPTFLKDISRSSSASTQGSAGVMFPQASFHTRSASLSAGRAEEYNRQQYGRSTLPGLSALASLASTKEPQLRQANFPEKIESSTGLTYHGRSFPATATAQLSFGHMPPVPTPGISGNNNMPPVCQNCETSTTPLWRRDESGSVLCNACGLFLKLHGRPRPISLKTDVIKSRNRVKSANQGPKKQNQPSLPASQSTDVLHNGAHRRVSQMSAQFDPHRSQSPISRTGTPSMHHDPNIAPQHMFDGVSLQDHVFQTPALPNLGSHPSPGSLASLNDRQLDPPTSYEHLLAQNTVLKTRVSELEVINMMYSDNENNLRKDRDDAVRTQEELKRRIEELERQVPSPEFDHPNKRTRRESPAEAAQSGHASANDMALGTEATEANGQ